MPTNFVRRILMAVNNADSFKNCLFNPLVKDLIKAYPVLKDLLPKCDHAENVLRYILALYDPKSPLIKEVKNMTSRKQEAARIAGFNLEKDSEFLDEMFLFKNSEVTIATCSFLRNYVNEMLWSTIVAHEQVYYEYHARLMETIVDNKAVVDKKPKGKKKEDVDDFDDEIDEDFGHAEFSVSTVNQKDAYSTVVLKEKLREGLKNIYNDLKVFYREMYEDDDLRDAATSTKITPETMSRV